MKKKNGMSNFTCIVDKFLQPSEIKKKYLTSQVNALVKSLGSYILSSLYLEVKFLIKCILGVMLCST